MPDAGKRNILERNLFRLQRVLNCSAAWSRTPSKEQRLSPKPKYGPAILPCCERKRRRDARPPPFRLDRINAGLLVGPLEVGPHFQGLVDQSDKEKTRVDNAPEFWGPSKGRWSGFATRLENQAGRE